MASRRMIGRATLRALVGALAAMLLLVPCSQGGKTAALAVHTGHVWEGSIPALAAVDPLSDQRVDPAAPQVILAAMVFAPALVAMGRVPADSRAPARPALEAPSRVLRGPPLI